MSTFKEISPYELKENTFKQIGKDWMLITSHSNEHSNAMTASWGGFGVMWGKPVAFVVIRPQRYTKEFIDISEKFSLTFFNDEYKKMLNYFGTVSGRDEDKITTANLTLNYENGTPYFEEAQIALICKNLFKQSMDEKNFINEELINRWYPQKDFHTLYIAEIETVLLKNN